MNSSIAIIPARGGSKRIPRKNIAPFLGRPLIAWTIEAALEARVFDRVIVSTECQETAEIAVQFGAEVPFLRADYFDDMAPSSAATIAALGQAEEFWNTKFEEVVQLMPNCPLRRSGDIVAAMGAFREKAQSFQISVSKFGSMNPWWALKCPSEETVEWLFPKMYERRSQDLPELFCPTGAIWIARRKPLIEQGTFYGKGFCIHPMPWQAAVDIDTAEDLEFANVVAQNLK